MATILSAEELSKFRKSFDGVPESLSTLDVIELCDGNIEQAISALAPQFGINITRDSEKPIDKYIQGFSHIICDEDFMDEVMSGLLTAAVGALAAAGQISTAIATPIVLYVAKKSVKKWCSTRT
ncbi:hypothetical protein Lepto7376_2177 [[Leptolyngbya] sp. PCC 7376]|uniref:hypothetical protein n=1 Tax=[Leptolyngbya] sp. PCC 7376 TaxID=111781 RepID=UPI00029F2EF5|nr:hypothetical protein [[Leptolyngbya] sp. PCC 7376]AFY38472.1 hypothetical protein Lepto7376_2177 [[Leptolyngbya] sp. PCC 7376]